MIALPRSIPPRRHPYLPGIQAKRLAPLCLLMLLLSVALPLAAPRLQVLRPTATGQAVGVGAALAGAPLMFVENVGQLMHTARYAVVGSATGLAIAEDGIWLTIRDQGVTNGGPATQAAAQAMQIKLSFVGANPHPRIEPIRRLGIHIGYYTGADSTSWRSNLPAWGGVRYRDLYPGIDWELSGAGGQLASRLIARHSADLAPVRMRVEGADDLALHGNALHLTTALGTFALPLPLAVAADGAALPFAGLAPSLQGADLLRPFAGANPDSGGTSPPTANDQPQAAEDLVYSMLIGGSGDEEGGGITVGSDGAVYMVGYTTSTNLIGSPGPIGNPPNNGTNALVVKVNSAGTSLVYLAIIGGNGIEYANDIEVDASGAVYVGGYTSSTNFPVTSGAFDTTSNVNTKEDYRDGFMFKLSPTAELDYSTYIGGSGDERATNIALDGQKSAYLTGMTASTDFPITPGAYQETNKSLVGTPNDIYVVKLNQDGSDLVFSTYLGGTSNDRGGDIKVDVNGAIYVTGRTESSNFPTFSSFGSIVSSGQNVFVTKLHPSGSSLLYSTVFGGNGNDNGLGIAVDTNGAAYITGYTASTQDFPSINAFDTSANGNQDAFAAKLNPAGALTYATYLGGSSFDEGTSIVVNANDEAYVAGFTQSSTGFPTSNDAYQPAYNGEQDAFLVKLNSTGSQLLYGTFLGGNQLDSGDGMAISNTGGIYLTGEAGSASFPTTHGPSFGGGENDIFVAKFQIDQVIVEPPKFTISGRITTGPSNTPVAGITVSAGSRSTTTDSNGNYSLADLAPGNYTVIPSKPNSTFQPASTPIDLSANATGINFILQTSLFEVSGRAIDRAGAGLPGVTISAGAAGSAITDANGRYAMELAPGTYRFTPSRDKYGFEPPSQDISVANSDVNVQPFTGRLRPQTQYISLMRRDMQQPGPTPTPEPKCDAYEPNNDRYDSATPRIDLNKGITAKICQKEGVSPPDPLYQDNYRVNAPQSKVLQIQLTLPETLRNHIALLVYDRTNEGTLINPLPNCYKDVVRSTPFTMNCSIPKAGEYIVRLYSDDGTVDNTNEYTLKVTQ